MYASLDFMTKGTKSIEVTTVSRPNDPFFTIELRDDGGRTTLMLSPDQLSQIITAATAAYTELKPPVDDDILAGPTCDTCGREARLRHNRDDSDNYEWVTPGSPCTTYTAWCQDVGGRSHHHCTVDNQDYVTKSFADAHPELVVL